MDSDRLSEFRLSKTFRYESDKIENKSTDLDKTKKSMKYQVQDFYQQQEDKENIEIKHTWDFMQDQASHR